MIATVPGLPMTRRWTGFCTQARGHQVERPRQPDPFQRAIGDLPDHRQSVGERSLRDHRGDPSITRGDGEHVPTA